jgi:hypothetical protein
MNAKVSAKGRTKARNILKVVGVAAALLAGSTAVFAEPHGGGGGHASGGHFSAPHYSGHGGGAPGGAHYAAAPHYAAGAHYAAAPHYAAGGHTYGGGYGGGVAHPAVRGYAGYGYGGVRGGFGYGYRPAWGGGYWHGGFWPSAYYGWNYPLFLGVLPAVYSTYWWGGVPYYYVNNVYYTYNNAENGYVPADPPPVAGDYSEDVNAAAAAGPDGGNAQDAVPPDVAQGQADPGIIAYPRNGQSEQQQSQDQFQCHSWAKGQTGFDPTNQASSGAPQSARANYGRAMAACLDARGYTVR